MDLLNLILTVVALVVFTVIAFALYHWAYAARDDRAARIGLYIVFGIPAFLITLSGVALLARGDRMLSGPILLVGLCLGLPLLKPIRVLLAAVTPMDADSPVDMLGLMMAASLGVAYTMLTRASLDMIADQAAAGEETALLAAGIPDLVVQGIWWVVLSLVVVGFWLVRSLPAALARLGITRPSWRTLGAGIGFLVVTQVVVFVIGYIAQIVQPNASGDVDQIVQQMTANIQNPLGAIILGLSAGVGEEAMFRGALQPRFGIVLTSILFTMLHTGQYGINFSTVGIFAISVLLGIERQRFGTVAAMTTHTLFDITQVALLFAFSE